MIKRKGIILAGGTGSRLSPLTCSVSKQLLPVFDKPLIFYPLSILMLSGIREILVITTPRDKQLFVDLLGDGSQWGINFLYQAQEKPNGIAEAYILGRSFLDSKPSALILGDNIFHGANLTGLLQSKSDQESINTIFGYNVDDASNFGVVRFNEQGVCEEIVEKPVHPPSTCAVTGLYFLDGSAPERAKCLAPSRRNELEITDLLSSYLDDKALKLELLGRGNVWLDSGTHDSLLDASNYVRTIQNSQGMKIACLDEIAFQNGWIGADQLIKNAAALGENDYSRYILSLSN